MRLLSLIIPFYNSQQYLERCLESVINQTYPYLEIILINDGSEDNSSEICKEYARKDKRIIIHHQKNAGVSVARNMGIQLARGEFIQFVDSDDYLEINMCKKMMQAFEEEAIDVVMCSYLRETKSGRLIQSFNLPAFKIENNTDWQKHFRELYENYYMFNPCNKVYRKAIIDDYNIRMNEEMSLAEDLDFNLKYLRYSKKISVISDAFYHYVIVNPNSLTQQFRKYKKDIDVFVYRQAIDFCKTKEIEALYAIGKIYLKSCFTSIERIFHPQCDFSTVQKKAYVQNILSAPETKECLSIPCFPDMEMKLYQIIIRSKCFGLLVIAARIRLAIKSFLQS